MTNIILKEASWSMLNTFRMCQRKWWYSYISDVKPQFVPVSLAFGSFVHRGAEHYYKAIAEGKDTPTPQELTQIAQGVLDNPEIKYNGKSREDCLIMANTMFERLCALEKPVKVLGVEKPVTVEIAPDFKLNCVIDLLTADREENLCVTDFKTSAKRLNGEAGTSGQLTTYSLIPELKDAKLKFVVFLKTKACGIEEIETQRNDGQRRQIVQDYLQMKETVESADCQYPRCPGWMCANCQYAFHCQGGAL